MSNGGNEGLHNEVDCRVCNYRCLLASSSVLELIEGNLNRIFLKKRVHNYTPWKQELKHKANSKTSNKALETKLGHDEPG